MTQLESHLTLGQFLRQEREKRGISIEQVASATKIGVRQLHALESDQYTDLPARPFIRGFVTSYVRFIGLDYKEVLTHFNSFVDSKVRERPNREAGHSGYVFERREGSDQSRMILGIVMGSFVVLGAITIFVLKPNFLHRHKHTHADSLRSAHPHAQDSPEAPSGSAESGSVVSAASTVPAAEITPGGSATTASGEPLTRSTLEPGTPVAKLEEAVPPLTAPAASPVTPSQIGAGAGTQDSAPSPAPSLAPSPVPPAVVAKPSAPDPADPLNSGHGLKPSETQQRLVIRASETVWVRYRVDDKPPMRFPLKKDKILILRARHGIVLQLGNMSHAEISHNGQGYRPAPTYNPITVKDDATLSFPPKPFDINGELFPGEKPLIGRPVTKSHSEPVLPATR